MAMKNCGIMDALKAAVEDKKDAAAREVSANMLEMSPLMLPLCIRTRSRVRANVVKNKEAQHCAVEVKSRMPLHERITVLVSLLHLGQPVGVASYTFPSAAAAAAAAACDLCFFILAGCVQSWACTIICV